MTTNISKQVGLILINIMVLTLLSCTKNDSSTFIDNQNTTIHITLSGIEADNTEETFGDKKASISQDLNPKRVEVPLNNNVSAFLQLHEINNENSTKEKLTKNKVAASEISAISLGIKYGIMIYENDMLVENGHKIYTVGKEADTEPFKLESNKKYQIVAYSTNNNELPTVSSIQQLSKASINDVSGDLLYYSNIIDTKPGQNNVSIVFKHKYTLITTELRVGQQFGGKIQQVQDANFDKVRRSGSIKLQTGALTYNDATKYEIVQFNNNDPNGSSVVRSIPTLLAGPNSSNTVTFAIPSIKVNGQIFMLPATTFNFKAGKKYKLDVTFDVPCSTTSTASTLSVQSTVNIAEPLNGEITIDRPAENKTIDINFHKLDNSFNIFINGRPIFTRQYQMATRTKTNNTWSSWFRNDTWTTAVAADMEGQYTDGQLVNTMQFTSGTNTSATYDRWGSSNNAQIYDLSGNDSNPVLRVRINHSGTVTITSKKTNKASSQVTLYNRPDFTIPNNSGDRTNSWFKKQSSNNNTVETAISVIRFNTNNVAWNTDDKKNTIRLSMDQSSQPTIGLVNITGATVYNNVNCN